MVQRRVDELAEMVDSEPWSTQASPSAMEHTGETFAVSPCVSSVTPAEVPDNVDEFIDRCKQAEAGVVDETATAPMVEGLARAIARANEKTLFLQQR